MQTLYQSTPTPGIAIAINTVYQSGFVEIINDTQYSLNTVIPGKGQNTLIAGYSYLFPIAKGGMSFDLMPSGYLDNQDVNTLTVNVYHPGEINPNGYPLAISRQQQNPSSDIILYNHNNTASVTVTFPIAPSGKNNYLTGFDFTAETPPGTTSYQVFVNIENVENGPAYYVIQSPTIGCSLLKTFPFPLPQFGNTPIDIVAEGYTLYGNLCAYGYQK